MIRSHFAENPDHVFNDFLKKPKHFVVKLAEAAGYMLEIEEYFCQPLD
jgi:hypothetical protein